MPSTTQEAEPNPGADPAGWLAARSSPLDLNAQHWKLKGTDATERWVHAFSLIFTWANALMVCAALIANARDWDSAPYFWAWTGVAAAVLVVALALRISPTEYQLDTRPWRLWRRRRVVGIAMRPVPLALDRAALTVASVRNADKKGESWTSALLLATEEGDVIPLVDSVEGEAETVQPVAVWLAERMGLAYVPTATQRHVKRLVRSADGSSLVLTRDPWHRQRTAMWQMMSILVVGVASIIAMFVFPPPRPTAEHGDKGQPIRVLHTFDEATLLAAMKPRLMDLNQCGDGLGDGTTRLRVSVSERGQIGSIEVVSDRPMDEGIRQCLVTAARTLPVPRYRGKAVTVEAPIRFDP
ncbi:MAG: hypothetical protein KC620_10755 [Myxococcales bacterium]|nr:hypothetical protein [Myxococcales bacterium]